MTHPTSGTSRRRFLAAGAAAGAGALAGAAAGVTLERSGAMPGAADAVASGSIGDRTVPFYGRSQAGITAPPGAFASLVSLTLKPGIGREKLRSWMRIITDDASRLTQGIGALADLEPELSATPAGLTVTVGFGRGFVSRAGGEQPEWLRDLPSFPIDKLEDKWSGGDVLFLVAADEPVTVSHTVRMLLKDSRAFATIAWRQDGFRRARGSDPDGRTMRNLFGQVDGTANPRPGTADFDRAVWSGADAPAWIQGGGTSFVVRRVAMDLDTWDAVDRKSREAAVGRRLDTGAPLTGVNEHDALDLDAVNANGLTVISSVAHARRAHVSDPGTGIVRLGYSYDEPSTDPEKLDQTGLIFGAFQADVTKQFVPIQHAIAEADLLNVWTTPIGSAVFAIPPGCEEGGYIGETLLE